MNTLTCESVARAALGEPTRRRGQELLWRCPQHKDEHESLSVNPKKNVFACFPCKVHGKAWQLAAFIAGLDPGDKTAVTKWLRERGLLNGNGKRETKSTKLTRNPSATYEYRDAGGNPVARKFRFEPGRDGRKKDFSWQRWENGQWVDGLNGIKPSLYRYLEIKKSTLVVLTEGEKDADAGARIGLPTATSGGVGSFREDHADLLDGKQVVRIVDADPPGRKDAQEAAAKLHGKSVSIKLIEIPGSKDLAEAIGNGISLEALLALFETTPEWKPANGSEVLDATSRFIRRFVSLSDPQARGAALWVAHTHSLDAADCSPYLSVNSAEKESGKTRLLEVFEVLVANPWLTGRASPAVLARKIDAEHSTLLLDESDTAFGGDREYAETLRGVLNTGYRRGGVSSCCVGQGANIGYKDFSTFCPKAIAGIGKLPDTVASRSIPIRLKRAPRGLVQKFRKREAESEASEIGARLAAWCETNLGKLRDARPEIPQQLSDRQGDVCEPLFAIADLAGGNWPNAAREALVELCAEGRAEDNSIGVKLLSDIRRVFYPHDDDGEVLSPIERIASLELAKGLGEMEDRPWAEWGRSEKPMTQPQLARQLARYDIRPETLRLPDGRRLKGYSREQFEIAWELYLPPDSPQSPSAVDLSRDTVTTRENSGESGPFQPVTPASRHASEKAITLNKNEPCHGVTARIGAREEDGLTCPRCRNQEQNLAAAQYHYNKLCPMLGK